MNEPLVELRGLKQHFPVETGLLERLLASETQTVKAVDGVDLTIDRGETLGLVGESGCGKSTLGKTVLQLLRPTAGEVWFDGGRIDTLSDDDLRPLRERMQFVFQDPAGSLNPRRRVRAIVRRPLEVHGIGDSRRERDERTADLVERVGLSRNHLDRYPHEFSGGQQQRIAIARALSVNPEFVVLDEPTSALDVSVQANIISLLEDLQRDFELTYLFITHDLSVVRHISDRVAVMYLGELMERGTVEEVFGAYQHPYTYSLLESIPATDLEDRGQRVVLRGEVPSPIDPPSGCKFRTRCPIAIEECAEAFEDRKFSETHTVHCIRRSPEEHGGSATPVEEPPVEAESEGISD
ncbi:ABC transporter ATP-binding protein [Halorussus salinisoli]|uniref:ABC transporter ATP-binding protein n=1 Tax=Halorussus salinisoli TaxID=2558242 RepID=UPI0010C1F35A|nr:ABC transporter ATP-binding protein [Halorussus salinisoli]